ncbi:MAG TPA: hypothetical protein VGB88_12765 [Alphaproteobacteria bacterium]
MEQKPKRIEKLTHVPVTLVAEIVEGFEKDGAVRIVTEREDDQHRTVTAEFAS